VSKITIDLDVGIWMNDKGQVQLFVGDEPKAVETISLLDLVTMAVEAIHLDHWRSDRQVSRYVDV
jgi:hypothetical protein